MPSKKSRRGSTLVMVALMLVAFMGVGAIAADIGRFYVVTGELQTASDAAALVGGMAIPPTSGELPKPVVDTAVMNFVAATNRANSSPLGVTTDSIFMAYYTPPSPSGGTPARLDYGLRGRRPNAVTVATAIAPKGMFSQIIGQTVGLKLSRRATAWLANLNSGCVRGMLLPYPALWKSVSNSSTNPSPAPVLDPVDFAAYMKQSVGARTFVLLGPNENTTGMVQPQLGAVDGNWRGVGFNGNTGKAPYVASVSGCVQSGLSTASASDVIDSGIEDWTDEGLAAVCNFKSSSDVGCYSTSSSSTEGVSVVALWADAAGGGGAFGPLFRFIGRFTVTCYFRTGAPTESCGAPGAPSSGFPKGTIVGYVNSLGSTTLKPNDVLDNTLSNVQRVILIK
jgi:hypothetical protein